MSEPAPLKTITVIETTVLRQGRSQGGKDWTLWEVTAVGENGEPIEENLKSFDHLQGTIQVEVERQEHEKYGVSYLLKLPSGSPGSNPAPAGARLGPKVDEVRERLETLERRVAALEEQSLHRMPDGRPYGTPPAPANTEPTF